MIKTKALIWILILAVGIIVSVFYIKSNNTSQNNKNTISSNINEKETTTNSKTINFNLISGKMRDYLPESIDISSLVASNYEDIEILKYDDFDDRFQVDIGNKKHPDCLKIIVYKKNPSISLYNSKNIRFNKLDIVSSQSGSIKEAIVNVNEVYIYIKTYTSLDIIEIIKSIKVVSNN